MARSETELRERARLGYELGRLRAGVRGAWPLAFLLPLALVAHGAERVGLTLLAATGAFLTATLLGWRGGAYARGATAGFIAGLPPLVLPVVVMSNARACGECEHAVRGMAAASWPECVVACAVGGVVAGVLVGLRAAREPRAPERYALAAALVAWWTGMLGCTLIGPAGALGIFAGLLAGAAPALIISTRRAG